MTRGERAERSPANADRAARSHFRGCTCANAGAFRNPRFVVLVNTEFMRTAEERYERPLPRYVRRAFERYLRCGIPEHGFIRLRCDDCALDRIVAFSCKERGVCPSCAGRIMANAGAHITDRVLPNVPIRQWVLSLPFDLRVAAARDPGLVSAIDRILFAEVQRWMRRRAGPSDGRAGAITFVQRFGGSLNLHVHFHVLFLDGLFTRQEGELPIFHRVVGPTRTPPPAASAAALGDALDGCARVAVQRGLFEVLPTHERVSEDELDVGKHSVALDGFNLHAAVAVGADDDVARERLVRYCARPSFALERLSILPDGRIAYRIKQPRKNATHRILEPIELLARIAALIPPPRHPSIRYQGVLAPSSRWRSAIVPRPDTRAESVEPAPRAESADKSNEPEQPPITPPRTSAPRSVPSSTSSLPISPNRETESSESSSHRQRSTALAPATYARLTIAHQSRVGKDLAYSRRLEWSKLLRRTFAVDVLECPRCRGRCSLQSAIQDPDEARRFLTALDELSTPQQLTLTLNLDPADAAETAIPPPDDDDLTYYDDRDELSPPSPDD